MIRKCVRVRGIREVLKRTACCLMSAGLIITAVPTGMLFDNVMTVQAADLTYTEGNSTYTYSVNVDDTVTIKNYSGTDTEITVPAEIDGKRVTAIGRLAFWKCLNIVNVIIPNSVTDIGVLAFYSCSNLEKVEIAEGVINIDNAAFEYCESLKTITLPSTLKSIGDSAFKECGFVTIEIPDGVTYIGEYAFNRCKNLMQIEIPNGVKCIDAGMFYYCNNLEKVVLHEGLNIIGGYAFDNCRSLKEINLPTSLTDIGSKAFSGCSSLTEIEIPVGLRTIEGLAFQGCSSLQSINIPSSVSSIASADMDAFMDCSKLESINVDMNNASYKSVDGILYDKAGTTLIRCPENKKEAKMLDTISDITMGAFKNCKQLEALDIPNGVTDIRSDTFVGCSSLIDIEIPVSMKSIERLVFNGCDSLELINVDRNNANYQSVEGVLYDKAGQVLMKCPAKRKEVKILDTVNKIESFAFENCNCLVSLEIPNGVTELDVNTFAGCSSLKEIILPEGLKSIGDYVFDDCSSLTSVTLPKSLTDLGYAFNRCSSLNEINVALNNQSYQSVDGILYDKAFITLIKCPERKEKVEIPNTVTSISIGAFENCSDLKEINIPSSVKEIVLRAFKGCNNLETVEIPESVTSIGDSVFLNCVNLKSIKILSDYIGRLAFYYAFGYIENANGGYDKVDGFTIIARVGSDGETYAKEKGFNFIELKDMSSDDDIHVEYEEPSLSEGVTLQTKVLTESDEAYGDINFEDKIIDGSVLPEDVLFSAYDISLVNGSNQKVQPNGNVTVKIPVPTGYDGNRCKVYRVNDEGSFTDMEAVYIGTHMIFETNHFSTYMITETELESNKASDVIYGDANSDGTVNSKDVVMLKKHLAGYKDLGINTDACDVNVDGEVNSKDAVLILKKLAGYDVEFGK